MGGGSAFFPNAGVGFRPVPRDVVGEAGGGPPGFAVQPMSGGGVDGHGVNDPAVAVELVLIARPVALPDRAAAAVTRPAVEVPLLGGGPPVEGEHHRHAGPFETAGVQQPAQEHPRLGLLSQGEERGDPDAGVPQPGVAVVPVPLSADVLGQ